MPPLTEPIRGAFGEGMAMPGKPSVLIVLMCIGSMASPSAHAESCPNAAPVARVESVKFYADAHASVLDKEKLRERNELILPIREFVTVASQRIDSADHAEEECAERMMLSWAAGRSLLAEPADIAGQHDRQIFAISLDIIALKLRAAGFRIDPLLGWLGGLNQAVINYFEKRHRLAAAAHRPQAGWAPVDNLYVWSGVNAASYALLSGDRGARRYEEQVWSEAIAAIRPDGYLESELRRGARALHYHAYDLSALLTLHAFRQSLGAPFGAEERAAVERLLARVGAGFCDPSAMAAAVGGVPQETPVARLVGTGFVLAPEFLSQPVRDCLPNLPTTDPLFGGTLQTTARILANRPH